MNIEIERYPLIILPALAPQSTDLLLLLDQHPNITNAIVLDSKTGSLRHIFNEHGELVISLQLF